MQSGHKRKMVSFANSKSIAEASAKVVAGGLVGVHLFNCVRILELKFSPCHIEIRRLIRRTKHELIIKLITHMEANS